MLALGAHDATAPRQALDIVVVVLAGLDDLCKLAVVLIRDCCERTARCGLLVAYLPNASLALHMSMALNMTLCSF